MVRFFGVTKIYPGGVTALQGISFSVERGEFVFVTGPSGAGKTTLLKLIILAERPDRGEILLDGVNITRMPSSRIPHIRRRVGFVFQDFKLIPTRTVLQNVALPLEIAGFSLKKVRRRIEQVLRLVGIGPELYDHLPQRLSGGEQQRVAIARALVGNPPLIVADEPTGNLDPKLTLEVMDLFEKINMAGTTLIVATHDTTIIERMKKRTLYLEKGRIVGDETP